ncbi:C4b-binding protein alpha chain-like [Scyliorhinus canicula]|uniref:C4b-binding protein alpha chain-like n=1 Tax=Scyliorhinus canicula TaxID=7830 RepID=UPI0018F57B0C|nr:C4b-binding protein alpha chain-like [Scyliorhinus canicula]
MAEKLLLALMATCTVWVVRVTGDCDKPPTLKNGILRDKFIFKNLFRVGDKVSYGCYPGYVLKEGGSRSITCGEDSTWPPLRIVCEPRNCGNPGEILNGGYTATGTILGNRVTFSCEAGYRMVGRAHRLCTSGGWDGQVPTCQSIRCENLPPIPNGRAPTPPSGDYWEYGMIAQYSCIGDYSLVGADELTCTAIGKWSNDPPRCKAVRCHRPELIANGQIRAGFGPTYRYRATITYACLEGYKMIGNSVIECGENNVFVPPPPTCKTRTCDDPPELEHGSPRERVPSGKSFDVGSRVLYRCERGYILKQGRSRYVTCQHDFTWTRLQTICEPRHCGNPGEILNGYFSAPDDSLGNKAVFYCDKGHGIVGRDHRICTPDGWDGQVPTCKPVNCGKPKEILNGNYKTTGSTIGRKATFYCNKGYRIVGRNVQYCTKNGWFGQVQKCESIGCQSPDLLANGHIVSAFRPMYKHRDTITYSCNEGYEMYGNNVIECNENNTFTPPPPTCRLRE